MAPAAMVKLAVTVVLFTALKPLTAMLPPPPATFTAVEPVKLVPVSVTGIAAPPRAPEVGLIEASVGPVTVNVTVLVVAPDVTTATFLVPRVAPAAIVNVAVTEVSLTTVKLLTVMPPPPPPPVPATPVAPVRPAPVKVTETAVPRAPVVGLIEASVGPVTVNVTFPVVPIGVTTATFLALIVAPAAIVKVAVTVVSLVALTPVTVTPPPDTVTFVAPVRC